MKSRKAFVSVAKSKALEHCVDSQLLFYHIETEDLSLLWGSYLLHILSLSCL